MKNKSLLVVSLLLIAFLIGTSYAPMAAKAETLQDREPATVPPKGESIEQAGGGNNPMAEKWGFYGIPGTALTPVYHEQIYGEDGNGCLWALKGSASNEAFTAPINVPDGARGVRLLGMYMNYQEVPDTPSDIWVYIYRKKWDAATVTTVSVVFALAMTLWVYKMSVFSSMGALSACMTNPPALSASAAQTETDIPTLAYASVYPVALIFKVILAQLLVEILYRLL